MLATLAFRDVLMAIDALLWVCGIATVLALCAYAAQRCRLCVSKTLRSIKDANRHLSKLASSAARLADAAEEHNERPVVPTVRCREPARSPSTLPWASLTAGALSVCLWIYNYVSAQAADKPAEAVPARRSPVDSDSDEDKARREKAAARVREHVMKMGISLLARQQGQSPASDLWARIFQTGQRATQTEQEVVSAPGPEPVPATRPPPPTVPCRAAVHRPCVRRQARIHKSRAAPIAGTGAFTQGRKPNRPHFRRCADKKAAPQVHHMPISQWFVDIKDVKDSKDAKETKDSPVPAQPTPLPATCSITPSPVILPTPAPVATAVAQDTKGNAPDTN